MCLAATATDPETAGRLAQRLSPGTTWVSHLLQRITHAVLRDPDALALIDRAGIHYAAQNTAFAAQLTALGLPVEAGDGMSLWVPVPVPARVVAERLMRRGWLVRTGDDFRLAPGAEPSRHLRLTVHDLTSEEMRRLAEDLAASTPAQLSP